MTKFIYEPIDPYDNNDILLEMMLNNKQEGIRIKSYAIEALLQVVGLDNEPDDIYDTIMNDRVKSVFDDENIISCTITPYDWKLHARELEYKLIEDDEMW